MLKCILCGINIKTAKFEKHWQSIAEERGLPDLYSVFENREMSQDIQNSTYFERSADSSDIKNNGNEEESETKRQLREEMGRERDGL